ncbi:MAG TPA: RNA polymerase sigma factor [Thermoanaerobaculaceae bacterium]|nr:RNA polymerase sigma factor [Thermoanaerobaculaceae bacterium]
MADAPVIGQLPQGALKGPQEGRLEDAYHAHRSAVMAFLRRHLRSEEDAEDLTHDTFIRANGSGELDRLRHPGAFLIHIARNLMRDRFRRQKLATFSALEDIAAVDLADPAVSPEQIAQGRAELRLLARALMALPERTRQAVILCKFHHLTYRQVAAVMGTSPKTVEKQIARGVAECRRVVRGEVSEREGDLLRFSPANAETGAPAAGRRQP